MKGQHVDDRRFTNEQEAALEAQYKKPFELVDDVTALLEDLKQTKEAIKIARAEIAGSRHTIESLKADNDHKTTELRRLQDERDPAVVERAIREACERATARADSELAALKSTIATLRSEAEELKASKKKLREALERAKDGRR